MDDLEQAYKNALVALQPQGVIWKVQEGSVRDRELDIEAKMFAKVQRRAEKLISESNLLTTKDLLTDWEGVFELEPEGGYEDRIAALNAENAEGQLSIPQYENLCSVLGVTVKIKEHYLFRFGLSAFGGRCECGAPKMIFWWDIVIKNAESEEAVACMKAFIAKYKMSHTAVRYIDERKTV